MIIEKTTNGNGLTVALTGRLDTTTATQFEAELKQCLIGIKKLVLDLC